jgi:hypothetical protein
VLVGLGEAVNGKQVLEKLQEFRHYGYGLKVLSGGELRDIKDVIVGHSEDPDIEPAIVILLEE